MPSYRFARRSFLAGLGGAFGLEILLRNMEAAAQGAGPPPRFLMMHWPVGHDPQPVHSRAAAAPPTRPRRRGRAPATSSRPSTRRSFARTRSSCTASTWTASAARAAATRTAPSFATTGASSPGTRANGGEDDDGCAGGPSWDQILLKNVPALSRRNEQGTIIGKGYYNAICDKRVDSYETSTRCLSYGYEKQTINSARPGGTIRENKPLLPEMSPLTAYKDLFGGFVPGGSDHRSARRSGCSSSARACSTTRCASSIA